MIQFVKDFNKLVIKEMLLSALFVFLVGIFALVVGGLTCGIGLMFTGAAASMAAYHILFQLYELYLERGGAPVTPASSQPHRVARDADEPPYPEDDEGRGEPDDRIRRKR
jgi:hypothetical protein